METITSFMSNLSGMDLDIELDSASDIPFDISNYFIRVPLQIFGQMNERKLKKKYEILEVMQKNVGKNFEFLYCVPDFGYIQIEANLPNFVEFIKTCLGKQFNK